MRADKYNRDPECVQLMLDNQKKKSKSNTYQIYCENHEEREAWKKDLNFAINVNKIRHRMRKESILQKLKEEKEGK